MISRTYKAESVIGSHGKHFQVVNDLGGLIGYYDSKREAETIARQKNQDTIPFSIGHYWVNDAKSGVWRTARKNHLCKGGQRPYREHYIMAGERFLDTGERTPDGVWATYKCCQTCADSRAASIYGESQS